MFKLFKKKKKLTEEELLKAKLEESLARYAERQEQTRVDITNTAWTYVDLNGNTVRVPTYNVKRIEELNESEFHIEEKVAYTPVNRLKDS